MALPRRRRRQQRASISPRPRPPGLTTPREGLEEEVVLGALLPLLPFLVLQGSERRNEDEEKRKRRKRSESPPPET